MSRSPWQFLGFFVPRGPAETALRGWNASPIRGLTQAVALVVAAAACATRPARVAGHAVRPPPKLRFAVETLEGVSPVVPKSFFCFYGQRDVVCVEDQNFDGVPDLFAITQLDDDMFSEGIFASAGIVSGVDGSSLTGPVALPWPRAWDLLRFEELLQPLTVPASTPSACVAVLWERIGQGGLLWRQTSDLRLHARVSLDGALTALEDPEDASHRRTTEVGAVDLDQALYSILGKDDAIVIRTARIDGESLTLTDTPIRSPWAFLQAAVWLQPPSWRSQAPSFLFAIGPAEVAARSFAAAAGVWRRAACVLPDFESFSSAALLGRDARTPSIAFATVHDEVHMRGRLFAWEADSQSPKELPLAIQRWEVVQALFALPDMNEDGCDELGVLFGGTGRSMLSVLDVGSCETLASIKLGADFTLSSSRPFVFRRGDRSCVLHLVKSQVHDQPLTWRRIDVAW